MMSLFSRSAFIGTNWATASLLNLAIAGFPVMALLALPVGLFCDAPHRRTKPVEPAALCQRTIIFRLLAELIGGSRCGAGGTASTFLDVVIVTHPVMTERTFPFRLDMCIGNLWAKPAEPAVLSQIVIIVCSFTSH